MQRLFFISFVFTSPCFSPHKTLGGWTLTDIWPGIYVSYCSTGAAMPKILRGGQTAGQPPIEFAPVEGDLVIMLAQQGRAQPWTWLVTCRAPRAGDRQVQRNEEIPHALSRRTVWFQQNIESGCFFFLAFIGPQASVTVHYYCMWRSSHLSVHWDMSDSDSFPAELHLAGRCRHLALPLVTSCSTAKRSHRWSGCALIDYKSHLHVQRGICLNTRLAMALVGKNSAYRRQLGPCLRVSHTDEWPGTQYRALVSQSGQLTRLQKTSPLQDGTSHFQDILACVKRFGRWQGNIKHLYLCRWATSTPTVNKNGNLIFF